MKECELCPPIEKITPWIYDDEFVLICKCKSCGIPQIILKRHTTEPTLQEMLYAHFNMTIPSFKINTETFSGKGIQIRKRGSRYQEYLNLFNKKEQKEIKERIEKAVNEDLTDNIKNHWIN